MFLDTHQKHGDSFASLKMLRALCSGSFSFLLLCWLVSCQSVCMSARACACILRMRLFKYMHIHITHTFTYKHFIHWTCELTRYPAHRAEDKGAGKYLAKLTRSEQALYLRGKASCQHHSDWRCRRMEVIEESSISRSLKRQKCWSSSALFSISLFLCVCVCIAYVCLSLFSLSLSRDLSLSPFLSRSFFLFRAVSLSLGRWMSNLSLRTPQQAPVLITQCNTAA